MRESYALGQIPSGVQDVPYVDHYAAVNKYGQHGAEVFAGTVTGAGGVGGTLDLPFDPGYVKIVNPAGTPRVRELFVGGAVQVDATGAAATGITIANDGDGKPRRVTLDVAVAANGEVVQVLAVGFRNVNGSL